MIGNHFKALLELLSNWTNLVFWIVDLLYLVIGIFWNTYTPDPLILIILLLVGFVVSSVRLVVSKNQKLASRITYKPEISLYLKKVDNKNVLRVRNLSRLPLKDFSFSPVSIGSLIVYKFVIEGVNILKQDEERTLEIQSDSEFADLSHFGKYANADYKIEISYKDFTNNDYIEHFNLGKSGIKVITTT